MDSLLSNAQRCVRKADSLVVYGLFDEALAQLDKSVVLLNELKSVTSCYDSIQMINSQIDSIDRNMRSVAIKRSESIKKKNQIENLINKKRSESESDHKQNQSVLVPKLNKSVPLAPFTNASKVTKNDQLIIEELSTTNGEYKKVNEFLINEIELLKKENNFLKVELLKIHLNDSLNDLSSNEPVNSSSISNSSSSVLTTNSSVSSHDISARSLDNLGQKPSILTMTSQNNIKSQNTNDNRIDLSKYINNEDDSDDDDELFNELSDPNDSYTSSNMSLPPHEFIVD